jgi:EAL domain-containing protein (putative c-di-GMP-specific phosphodiesterase class I)
MVMLASACAGHGLSSHYQPIVDVVHGRVVGYEALARFSGYPVLNPETWFAAAREHGWLAELEAAALRSALAHRADLPSNAYLSVNLGPDVLETPPVRDVIAGAGPLGGLVVELTEHAKVDSYADLIPVLDRLRSDGALISLDDTGSGYAGLNHMLNIRPDFIKLDRTLITGIDRDESKQALVEMMGTLGSRLDSWLVAEGVETSGELTTLVRLGVPLVQGYHLARPAPAWADIDKETAARLARVAQEALGTTLRSLVDSADTAPSVEQGIAELGLDRFDVIVIVDQDLRPVSTVGAGGLTLPVSRILRFNVDTDLVEAAHRAVARPNGVRTEPLVCTDDSGRFVGVVRMESLVKALAAAATSQRLSAALAPSASLLPSDASTPGPTH